MTAAIADTAEAMELIAVQMLSIGFLLSDYNYYNNKLVKVFKGATPCIFSPRSTVQCRFCRDFHQTPGRLPLLLSLALPAWPS